ILQEVCTIVTQKRVITFIAAITSNQYVSIVCQIEMLQCRKLRSRNNFLVKDDISFSSDFYNTPTCRSTAPYKEDMIVRRCYHFVYMKTLIGQICYKERFTLTI